MTLNKKLDPPLSEELNKLDKPNERLELNRKLISDSAPPHQLKENAVSTPKLHSCRYLIVGSGRLSRHLQHYFNLVGIPYTVWNRKQEAQELEIALKNNPVVLLAISDQALASFYDSNLKDTQLRIVHFSGTFQHPDMISCHPLMSFSNDLYPLETYRALQFAVTGISSLQEILPELSNRSFQLKAQDKALYHAWCVLTAAGTQTLWKAAQSQLKSLGVPDDAFLLYAKQVSENFLKSPENALTGPWVRNDGPTIEKNLQALSSTPAGQIYELLRKGLL